ncbi:MAG: hypothetical protein VB074_11690 [Proteiniphilum sp.]|jgi:hypothetical protein|uniref:hypothetical protein n=1 Tax=Proteiniphilum sp. TaxID=1926877 RepID=UPI002B21AC94|nr:hypothetical protein [Proteiniphilum sp.]MEA5128840.1 hypothetical protein [Proteiniphilum sp.]
MKRIYMISLLICIIIAMPAFVNCSDDDKTPEDPNTQTPLPPVEVDRSNLFGIHAVAEIGLGPGIGGGVHCDPLVTAEMCADLCNIMGIKTYRLGMHHHWVLEYDDNEGKLKFMEDRVNDYKNYIALLRANGIKKILCVSPTFMYPYGHERSIWYSIPDPKTEPELYWEFLENIEEIYKLLGETFPDIDYWEVGNELNASFLGKNIVKNGYLGSLSLEENAPYLFSTEEIGQVTADLCFYASKGLKAVGSKALIATPGAYDVPATWDETLKYYNSFYDYIKSGNAPTSGKKSDGSRTVAATTNPDDYIDYLCWHAYANGSRFDWLDHNEAIYRTAIDHDDMNRKALVSEFGYYDRHLKSYEEQIANSCVPDMMALADRIPALESLYIFRMFNFVTVPEPTSPEQSFGLFYSPNQSQGAGPKPVAISLFYHFNGVEANSDPLFKYAK